MIHQLSALASTRRRLWDLSGNLQVDNTHCNISMKNPFSQQKVKVEINQALVNYDWKPGEQKSDSNKKQGFG